MQRVFPFWCVAPKRWFFHEGTCPLRCSCKLEYVVKLARKTYIVEGTLLSEHLPTKKQVTTVQYKRVAKICIYKSLLLPMLETLCPEGKKIWAYDTLIAQICIASRPIAFIRWYSWRTTPSNSIKITLLHAFSFHYAAKITFGEMGKMYLEFGFEILASFACSICQQFQ